MQSLAISKRNSVNPQSQMSHLVEQESSVANMIKIIDRNIDAMVLYKKNVPYVGKNQEENLIYEIEMSPQQLLPEV